MNGMNGRDNGVYSRNADALVDRITETVHNSGGAATATAERGRAAAADVQADSPEAILRLHLPTNHTYYERLGDSPVVGRVAKMLGAADAISATTATPQGLWAIVVSQCPPGCPDGDGYNATITGPGSKWARNHAQMPEVVDMLRSFGLIR